MRDDTITRLRGRRVWDSRGRPTVEVDIATACGATGRGIAPAGASRGREEAVDLRDGGSRFGGYDVRRAVAGVNQEIGWRLTGMRAGDQRAIDAELIALDGTPDKSKLGANALVAASLAALQAGAASAERPTYEHVATLAGTEPSVPLPEIQIFGGGAHAGRRVDVQDFMVMVPSAGTFAEALDVTAEIYRAAGRLLEARGASAGVADEGGHWPSFASNEEALETLLEAIQKSGAAAGDDVVISLDVAASEFGESGAYTLALDERTLTSDEFGAVLIDWIARYPIASIEDPLGEDDPKGLAAFTARCGGDVQIVGDDVLVTDARKVEIAAAAGLCNAALLKVNQVGTVNETMDAASAARLHGFGAIVSARSGETEDVAIAHLATGLGLGQLKVGSFTRSERMAKWNECLRIEEMMGPASFAGGAPLANTWWGRRAR